MSTSLHTGVEIAGAVHIVSHTNIWTCIFHLISMNMDNNLLSVLEDRDKGKEQVRECV